MLNILTIYVHFFFQYEQDYFCLFPSLCFYIIGGLKTHKYTKTDAYSHVQKDI